MKVARDNKSQQHHPAHLPQLISRGTCYAIMILCNTDNANDGDGNGGCGGDDMVMVVVMVMVMMVVVVLVVWW